MNPTLEHTRRGQLTLWDDLAKAAMEGTMSNEAAVTVFCTNKDLVAQKCYDMADAMLAERTRRIKESRE